MPIMLKATHRVRSPWSYLAVLVLAAALSACATAGAKDSQDRSYVYRSDDDYVRLVPIEPGASANSQPFVISTDQLRPLLAGIQVSGAASMRKGPVFSKEELDKIVPPLASALSQAGPNQDVTFAVTTPRGVFGSYSAKAITTGRLFVSQGSMNLIFGLMQTRYDPLTLDYNQTPPEIVPGTRARRVDGTVWKIDPGSGHFHEKRGDWLAFNRSAIPAAAAAPAAAPAPQAGTQPSAVAPAPTTIESKEQEIENRLRVLDDLRKKGVITEQEYQERRRAILQEL